MTMNMLDRWTVSLLALSILGLGGCKEEQHPYCSAFEFGDEAEEVRKLDDDPDLRRNCGWSELDGMRVGASESVYCAAEQISLGEPMEISIELDPEEGRHESWVVYYEADGFGMWWRNIQTDLGGRIDARVIAPDPEQMGACLDIPGDRRPYDHFMCFVEGLEDAEVLDTCMNQENKPY